MWYVIRTLTLVGIAAASIGNGVKAQPRPVTFDRDIRDVLRKCIGCHGADQPKGGLDLTGPSQAIELAAIVPHHSEDSSIIDRVLSADPEFRMPPDEALADSEIKLLRQWIDEGADWPGHWAYRKLHLPKISGTVVSDGGRNSIDHFVRRELRSHGLKPSGVADRRTLLRRLYFDLIGMPPSFAELQAFLNDERIDAYHRVVDRLLASPRYGERWARHWMDLVHFAESHGHDQDRPREHAWPYRDYLITRFNQDVPYPQFVQEQIAGDALFPQDPWAIVATGFLAAGPWDESSLRDIQENSIDREIGRYLDRDDIVMTLMSTFTSTSVHCARCHHHKFDPVTIDTYYGLQAVFAGIDKANRRYEPDQAVVQQRSSLEKRLAQLETWVKQNDRRLLGDRLRGLVDNFELNSRGIDEAWSPVEWVQVTSNADTKLIRQEDNSIYAEGSRPEKDSYTLLLQTRLPTIRAVRLAVLSDPRLPMKGPGRNGNGNLHLSEFRLFVVDPSDQQNRRQLKITKAYADFDQIEWDVQKAFDGNPSTAWGIYPQVGRSHYAVFEIESPEQEIQDTRGKGNSPILLRMELDQIHGEGHLIGRFEVMVSGQEGPFAIRPTVPSAISAILRKGKQNRSDSDWMNLNAFFEQRQIESELAKLPKPALVYSGTSQFEADGSFRASPEPRPVHVLERGEISKPLRLAKPTTLACVQGAPLVGSEFEGRPESERRIALAQWVSAKNNGLVWRSIVNRVWHYHFGKPLVDTPNDFGHAGSAPTHPELLEWLAGTCQEREGSLKSLHRIIVTSATYQQSSRFRSDAAKIDAGNRLVWRMNRRRLDAEAFRDSLLEISQTLDNRMGGPSDRQFNQSNGVHVTPVVDYAGFDVDHRSNYRRSVYRFIFRTIPDPFMSALDCPDASQLSPKRGESVTAVQALATMNDKLVIRQTELLAQRITIHRKSIEDQTDEAFREILGRMPTPYEQNEVAAYVKKHGLANACRLLVNTNEFMFVD
ncbi:MAG: DUF1553 domain-containing protein [Planctomycetaceae bacterium]|nr:DUF1553 domain-containing protein [Planctomycetaceae bacterium]